MYFAFLLFLFLLKLQSSFFQKIFNFWNSFQVSNIQSFVLSLFWTLYIYIWIILSTQTYIYIYNNNNIYIYIMNSYEMIYDFIVPLSLIQIYSKIPSWQWWNQLAHAQIFFVCICILLGWLTELGPHSIKMSTECSNVKRVKQTNCCIWNGRVHCTRTVLKVRQLNTNSLYYEGRNKICCKWYC